jgi:ABC-2 type transport system ATP-binding protein
VALVAAFASDVELLILDEPTGGLDPLMAEVFEQCINEVRDAGGTVLLSSHILAEVEAICDRVTIIRAGKTVESGSLAELRHLTRTSITAETIEPPAGLDELEGVHDLRVDDHRARFDVDTAHLNSARLRLQPCPPTSATYCCCTRGRSWTSPRSRPPWRSRPAPSSRACIARARVRHSLAAAGELDPRRLDDHE